MPDLPGSPSLPDGFKTHGVYRHACPNCGGPISDYRLIFKAPCEKCLRDEEFRGIVELAGKRGGIDRFQLLRLYAESSREGALRELVKREEMLRDFEAFFEKATGFKMWSAQKTWARRVLKGLSFSIIAPTGMGKTVFSLVTALYITQRARREGDPRGWRSYLVFPTTPLLLQAERKLRAFAENLGVSICSNDNWDNGDCIRILCIHGHLGKRDRETAMNRLKEGSFDILLTTSAFIHRNYELLKGKGFRLIVMDDVDAVLKSGRAVRRLLGIIGVEEEHIEKALTLVKAKSRLVAASGEERARLEEEIRGLENEVSSVRSRINTMLLVNSATGRPRGIYPKLFKVFMGFEAGSKPEAIRNIVDSYVEPQGGIEEELVKLVLTLRDGVLVFVPVDKGVEYAERIVELLREKGLRAEAFHSKTSIELLDAFAKGDVNVLVGVATYYGVMVRGIDLPERVKYVVFAGVPRHRFSSMLEALSPTDILRVLAVLRDIAEGEKRNLIERLLGRISSRLRRMSPGAVLRLREELARKIRGESVEETPLLSTLFEAYKVIAEEFSKEETWQRISGLGDVGILKENDKYYMLIPDVATYIQASGRASRLYPGGITKGLSIVVVDDKRLLNGLVRRMGWIFEDFTMTPLSQVNLEELMKQIEEERRRVSEVIKGGTAAGTWVEPVKTALMVVESPNKARTIAGFFGKPSVRVVGNILQVYEVTIGSYVLSITASAGHVYDLVTDKSLPEAEGAEALYGVLRVDGRFIPVYTDIKKCSNGHQFTEELGGNTVECPRCKMDNKQSHVIRKLDVIKALRELAEEVDVVFIGTDPDAEGEKIAWDLRVLLEPYANEVRRIEFHEVTRKAILNALREPRDFDIRLVESQIVRRIDDRWLGFSLSEKVQKYAWMDYCLRYLFHKRGLVEKSTCCRPNGNMSAGRVQTPVLGYIIEETDARSRPERYVYRMKIYIERIGDLVEVSIPYIDAKNAGIVDTVKKRPHPVEVEVVSEEEVQLNPPPPFTTDSLLEEASRTLGLPATRTMEIAQDLFETGLITYHRTDSTRVSDTGVKIARQYLEDKYGEKAPHYFKPRTWGEGGAHEAIRPTRPIDSDRLVELVKEGVLSPPLRLTRDHVRLYDLVFRRFIASQMEAAKLRKLVLRVYIGDRSYETEIYTEAVWKGYLEVYENVRLLGRELGLKPGERVEAEIHDGNRVMPPRLRSHDVIRWMKEQGIGRPSTYAKIVQTLIDRGYVRVTGKVKALIPTERGRSVFNFLGKYYGNVVSVDTTRRLEELMEDISKNTVEYQSALEGIYREVTTAVIGNHRVNELLEKMYREKCSEEK